MAGGAEQRHAGSEGDQHNLEAGPWRKAEKVGYILGVAWDLQKIIWGLLSLLDVGKKEHIFKWIGSLPLRRAAGCRREETLAVSL